MYTKQEASLIRKEFWTIFGQYMRPVTNAEGETISWVNYKTGIRHIFFRLDADSNHAAVGLELQHPDPVERQKYFEKLESVKTVFTQITGGGWEWKPGMIDEYGKPIGRISTTLHNKSVFKKEDWPAIISFLKAGIIALDQFWVLVKDGFE